MEEEKGDFFLFTYVAPKSFLWRSWPFPQCIFLLCTFASPQMRISTQGAKEEKGMVHEHRLMWVGHGKRSRSDCS